jgi:hypothetical protein
MRTTCSKPIGVLVVSVMLGAVPFQNGVRDAAAQEAGDPSADSAASPLVIYRLDPMSNKRALPDCHPDVPGTAGSELSLAGCRGEYESASFAVYARQDARSLRLEFSDLRSGEHILPASCIDPYVVKCWYQAGRDVLFYAPDKKLVPELLLKDDGLVRVDTRVEANYVRTTALDGSSEYLLASSKESADLWDTLFPIDADKLQPVSIVANSLKQFWLTVHIPDDAAAGQYTGHVRLSAYGIKSISVPIEVTVHPFDLAQPDMIYSIYHPSKLHKADPAWTIACHYKSEEQYMAELLDLKAHGVLYPNLWPPLQPEYIPRALELRKQAGLPNDILFALVPTGNPSGAAGKVKHWKELTAPFGYKDVYLYGEDEASGDVLRRQRPSWEAIQKAGGKTFASAWKEDPFEVMGSRLNVLVWSGAADPARAKKYHEVGSQIFCYSNPQGGVEEPLTYRYFYGLALWKAGYDGAMTFAYQHNGNHIWNDFDHPKDRDHCFTYPTVNGLVGTVQWEGFREAVDDVRYITTLEEAIAQAGNTEPARQAQVWLEEVAASLVPGQWNKMDPPDNLEKIRASAVEWIEQL